jgi:2'-5' RNA ligase
MQFKDWLLEMQNTRYDYSSIHVNLPDSIANDIVKWALKKIGDNDIFVSQQDPSFGREDEMHVTMLYGLHSESSQETRKLLKNEKPVHVKLGKIEVFTNPQNFDVVVIDVESEDLCRLNKKLRDNLEYTNTYDKYHPHATIAYVKKGKGWKYRGLDKWMGQEFTCDSAVFSSKNGSKENIPFRLSQ